MPAGTDILVLLYNAALILAETLKTDRPHL